MDEMNITAAQYKDDWQGNHLCIFATINDEEMSVPLDPGNRHYDEIMKRVADGDLTIADADD